MPKTIVKVVVTLFLLFVLVKPVFALENKVLIYFFWASGCPHCVKEKAFLKSLQQKYPRLEIKDYEITGSKKNLKLLEKVGKELSADVSGVPFTVIGKEYFSGYYSDETTGTKIEEAVKYAFDNGYIEVIKDVENITVTEDKSTKPPIESLKLPLLGEIKIKNLSLPVLTIVLGGLDGFNPCAMWTLLFLISLLLGMNERKRMWILGITFIVSSALVYFLFMAAWLNLLLFVGFIIWVRIVISLVALAGGIYNLREYLVNKKSGCKVTGHKKRQAFFVKLKSITQRKQLLLALGGIILLAFAVNLVELVCSAGLPVIFTQILTLSNLPKWQYYAYMLLYIFVFMFDDLLVFFTAMITLQMTGISSKYTRFSHLIGGILMLIIGVLLLFKPEWLMFG